MNSDLSAGVIADRIKALRTLCDAIASFLGFAEQEGHQEKTDGDFFSSLDGIHKQMTAAASNAKTLFTGPHSDDVISEALGELTDATTGYLSLVAGFGLSEDVQFEEWAAKMYRASERMSAAYTAGLSLLMEHA